jgi:hypothetical protein
MLILCCRSLRALLQLEYLPSQVGEPQQTHHIRSVAEQALHRQQDEEQRRGDLVQLMLVAVSIYRHDARVWCVVHLRSESLHVD